MKALDRKLLRDSGSCAGRCSRSRWWSAAGRYRLIGSVSTYVSLATTQQIYYCGQPLCGSVGRREARAEERAGPAFGNSGVAALEARIVKDIRVEWPRSDLSVAGRIVSVPAARQPRLNRLTLATGRWMDPLRRDEILVNTAFAQSWSIKPGENIDVILNGRITSASGSLGLRHRPSSYYAEPSGQPAAGRPHLRRALWRGEEAMASAFDMTGAFNNLALSLAPNASAIGR